jgi:prolyl oligopeptidase
VTEKRPVVEEHHGTKIEDPYRWLEDGTSKEVRAWSAAQNAAARAWLDAVPGVSVLRKRMQELMAGGSPSWYDLTWSGDLLFALKKQPPLQQPRLVAMRSPQDPGSETVIVDPNAMDPAGGTSIDWYVPSLDGKLVAVSLSRGGSESGDVHVFEAATGRDTGEVVPRVNGGTAGGGLAWGEGSTGFYYTRYPRPGERPVAELPFHQQVWWHALGTPGTSDRYETGKDLPRIAEIQLQSSRDGRWVLASVQNGDGGEFVHWLRTPGDGWRQLTRHEDRCVLAVLGEDDAVYLVSRLGAPRGKVLRLPLGERPPALADAAVVVPQRDDSIATDFSSQRGLTPTRSLLYVLYQEGGPSAVRIYDHGGKGLGEIPLLPISAVDEMTAMDSDDLLFQNQTFLSPPAWSIYRAAERAVVRTGLVETSAADFSDCQVVRDVAVSKDGTKVPLSIVMRRGMELDASHPTLLYGYGGYGISLTPIFRPQVLAWLEQGGVYVVANIRGGGEYGDAWHLGGNLTRKQNVFDDFAAASRRLVEAKVTTPERLAWSGKSNGGLLMGAMITQHPELARAAVAAVGIYDMLRVELTPNGAFNVPEFGTVADRTQFDALYAYSPYHHVGDGTKYPSVLFLTGENDPRVEPWQSRKMVARLQAANPRGNPVLLRTSASSGHGIGTALGELIEENVDIYAFLLHELGVKVEEKRPT